MSALTRRSGAAVLVVALVIVAVAVIDANRTLVDLTEDDTLTLSPQTVEVLGALDRDVEITAFIRTGEPGRVEAVSLLDRYRRQNSRIDYDIVDPDEAPGDGQRLGIDPLVGGVAVQAGDEVERVPFATEGELTAAVARLVRNRTVTACATTGHGERAVAGGALGSLTAAASLLERDGLVVREVDLLAATQIPTDCSVVVVADPSAPLDDAAREALRSWLGADGRLLWLADPVNEVDLSDVVAPLGLGIERGVVFEGDPSGVIGGDEASPIVRRYASGHPIVRRLAPTFFPGVQEVAVDDEPAAAGLTTTRLADTSELSYLERQPLEPAFDPDVDRGGPVTVAAAADRSRVDLADIRRSRAVVIGDADFVSDAFLGEAANAALLRQSINWLTESEDFAALSPNVPRERPLRLTDARVAYARVLTIGIVPSAFLLAGAMVWALRRRR